MHIDGRFATAARTVELSEVHGADVVAVVLMEVVALKMKTAAAAVAAAVVSIINGVGW